MADIWLSCSLFPCLTEGYSDLQKTFKVGTKSITTQFCLWNAVKASEIKLYVYGLSPCLLKLTSEGFWDFHSNGDSFQVEKEAN